jgi:hypothetical protein
MTPPAQQEYIITEDELDQWQTVTRMSPTCQVLRERIRTRPHTPLPKPETMIKFNVDFIEINPIFILTIISAWVCGFASCIFWAVYL